MSKLSKGLVDAVPKFLIVGVIFPFALDYFSPQVSQYVTLPPSYDRWVTLLIFGFLFALSGFLQSAYAKGEYPWLFGRIGGGIVSFAFYSYLFLFLPRISGAQNIQVAGLLQLVYLAIVLSYLYLVFDFFDARRSRPLTKPVVRPLVSGAPIHEN